LEIEPGDLVVISASPIPGNETVVSKTIDNLYRRGAKVLYSRIGLVHVHGHGSREELKMMLNLVRPKFFVPVHGEHRHLVTHAALAQHVGVPPENTFVLDDGDVLELTEDEGRVVGQVPADYTYVDGQRVWTKAGQAIDERAKLSRDGVVAVSAILDRETGEALKRPRVTSSGFAGRGETQELFEKVSEMVQTLLDQRGKRALELDKVKAEVTSAVSDFLYKETRRRPTVLALLERV
jgi:ribonuclease J